MTLEEAIKKLENYAKQKKIPFYSSSKKEYNIPNCAYRYITSRYVIYDLHKINNGLYFIFYDSSTGRTNRSWGNTFCGIFREIKELDHNIIIKQRYWLDKFSFSKRYLTGNSIIDKAITIHVDSKENTNTYYSEKKIQQLINIMSKLGPVIVEAEVEAWNIVPALDQKTLLSLTLNQWLIDYEYIDLLIN